MSRLITDEMVETFAIVGKPDHVIEAMTKRFSGLIDRTGFFIPGLSDEELGDLVSRLRTASADTGASA